MYTVFISSRFVSTENKNEDKIKIIIFKKNVVHLSVIK